MKKKFVFYIIFLFSFSCVGAPKILESAQQYENDRHIWRASFKNAVMKAIEAKDLSTLTSARLTLIKEAENQFYGPSQEIFLSLYNVSKEFWSSLFQNAPYDTLYDNFMKTQMIKETCWMFDDVLREHRESISAALAEPDRIAFYQTLRKEIGSFYNFADALDSFMRQYVSQKIFPAKNIGLDEQKSEDQRFFSPFSFQDFSVQ